MLQVPHFVTDMVLIDEPSVLLIQLLYDFCDFDHLKLKLKLKIHHTTPHLQKSSLSSWQVPATQPSFMVHSGPFDSWLTLMLVPVHLCLSWSVLVSVLVFVMGVKVFLSGVCSIQFW